MAVPGSESGGWLLDMATTTVALGKIHDASHRKEATIPAGWATDAAGVPTTDTQTALRGLPTPLGGYKGSASDCWWSFSPRDFPADRWRPMWDRCGSVLNRCA